MGVGTEKTITCANGENVVCNAGTYGCIDNSPTLYGSDTDEEEDTCWEPIPDSLIASMDTGDEWCAGNCVEGNEENCAAMCQPCDMIDGGDSGSLPPAYLQVPDFKSCLASETSEDGSYEQWCMPAQVPAGCATDSWTMLSSADMEMAACSNEEDEPTMVGTEKAITCANGENVVCNAGTYGCIDNSPTLCGNDNDKEEDTCWEPIPDSLIASMDTGDEWCAGNCVEGNEENCAAMCQPCDMIDGGDGGSLPPAYLQVPEFKSCLASETSGMVRTSSGACPLRCRLGAPLTRGRCCRAPTWRWLHAATRRTSLQWSALRRRSPAPMARMWYAMPARTAASTTVQPCAATTTTRGSTRRILKLVPTAKRMPTPTPTPTKRRRSRNPQTRHHARRRTRKRG